MNPYDYSADDLSLYYRDALVYDKEQEKMFLVDKVVKKGKGFNVYGEHYDTSIENLDDCPAAGCFRNGGISAEILVKTSNKQWRKGLTGENAQVLGCVQWGAEHYSRYNFDTPFKKRLRAFFESPNFPSPEKALARLKNKLSVAFSNHFALAIPWEGEDATIMRLMIPIGIYKDGKGILFKGAEHCREELEQYMETSINEA